MSTTRLIFSEHILANINDTFTHVVRLHMSHDPNILGHTGGW